MRERVVHAAIRVYPPRWRRRYGADLEQLILDTAVGRGFSTLDYARTIGDLLKSGAIEWLRPIGPRTQIALLTVFAGLACLMINSVGTGIDLPHQGRGIPAQLRLSDHVIVGSGIKIIHSRTLRTGPGSGGPSRPVIVNVEPVAGGISSLSGAPTRVFMDPKSGTVLAVTRRFTGGAAHQITMAEWLARVKRREAQQRRSAVETKSRASANEPPDLCSSRSPTGGAGSHVALTWSSICG